jgi:hypothetical protein
LVQERLVALEVCDPDSVGARGGEVPIQKISCAFPIFARDRRSVIFTAQNTTQALITHEAINGSNAHVETFTAKVGCHLAPTV